jgi:hypothetical protein
MKSCFELATRADIDHQRRLEECQNRDFQRHTELREEVHALQAMVSNLVTHVQGLVPLRPAVSEPAEVPAQPQEPVDEVSPEMEKLAKAYVKAHRRMLMQRKFSEWCKFAYKRKVSKHDWCPEQGGGLVSPAERAMYYMEHDTSHGSARAGKGKQGGHEVIPSSGDTRKVATPDVAPKRVTSAVAAGAVKCCNESCDLPRQEGSCPKSGNPKQACSKECFKAQGARLEARCSSQRQSKAQASSGKKAKDVSTSEGSASPPPSTSESESEDGDMCGAVTGPTAVQRARGLSAEGSMARGPSSVIVAACPVTTVRRRRRCLPPSPRQENLMATVMKAEQFIDDAAKGGSEEEEWESQDEGTPVEEAEDGTGVALLPLVPLPGDHHLHAWMRPNLVRKAELALSVAEATRLAQLKPKDATRQDAMKALIAQTKEYHDLPLSAMHESMKEAYNASLAK